MFVIVPLSAAAAPYAAYVIDARSGKVLHSENANARLHPASLTKMMTLYIAFEAIEHGEIGLDDDVVITRHAANEPPSKLGLKPGQRIKLRYLIRGAAVKSANDAATAIGVAIAGSEAAFARRMNRTAQALGMSRTTFKNAHGLTEEGHLSTARDMTVMGRHLFYDYPEYYNLFSRISADAGVRKVYHTNRKLLRAYRGADGIKTGYTRAAGFNLVASAERGSERVIATVFGGRSTATRNAQVAKLLDLGFKKAPTRVAVNRPSKPRYMGSGNTQVIRTAGDSEEQGVAGKTIRLAAAAAVTSSLRPRSRPAPDVPQMPMLVASQDDIQKALMAAQAVDVADVAPLAPQPSTVQPAAVEETIVQVAAAAPAAAAVIKPVPRPSNLTLASLQVEAEDPVQEIVTRISTSGGRNWGINVGRYSSEYKAQKILVKTALSEMSTLDGSLRKIVTRSNGYDANFMGLTRETADLACRRLQSRKVTCFMIEPG
ncbi:D-alanyl-D-alanine carboxypeptidase family protein [Roseovarius sp. M141]|uniref:D-alanyl-D-alanine carboxypeptidase family protein n=1 Tax=Roseovarius sp. M141 TaxID=2583806 RepID=UPI0020CCCF98|nr:D-alanyl-D-alanine carboxypeptidase family protein [Roseovarius sp. M141]MCQ0093778.1 D-alanyl-D-alanine carboxypeptidase [Roseovarius sp. M141]